MGYSCTTKASQTNQKWELACRKSTGSSNTWKEKDGTECFYEIGRENGDGAITGTVYRLNTAGYAHRSGSFRINPDGTIARAPAFLKTAAGM